MANYYWITIKSKKMTQEVAAEIFTELSKSNLIRAFEYDEGGCLHFNSRGVSTRIGRILYEYGFADEEIEIKDEFELLIEEEVE